jgi:hypothetical protein
VRFPNMIPCPLPICPLTYAIHRSLVSLELLLALVMPFAIKIDDPLTMPVDRL